MNRLYALQTSIRYLSCVLCLELWVSENPLHGICAVFDSQSEYQILVGNTPKDDYLVKAYETMTET